MDAMAGITDAAAAVDVVITTDAAAGIPSVKASVRDTGRDIMMRCGTAATVVAVTMMAAVADAAVTVMAAVADAVTAAISPYALMPLPA